jgi:hypothetical protein
VEPTFKTLAVAQRRNELLGRETEVHKVAETAAVTLAVLVLSAASFAEIRNGGELGV